MTSTETHDESARRQLREAGLRATPARVAVLGVLRSAGNLLSHAEVVEQLDGRGWDPATIFRNLVTLAEVGFVRRTDVGDHVWRFELVEEDDQGITHEHAHFLCKGCGEVTCMPEFELKLPRGSRVPRSVKAHAVDIQLHGLCDQCE
nr:transcriptional repressor [Deltaproteobacteria bacterium]